MMRYNFCSVLCCVILSIGVQAQAPAANSQPEAKKADPAARNMLQSTRDTRQNFPQNLAGVTTEILFNDNGKIAKGSLNYEAGKSIELKIEGIDEEVKAWVNDQIQNIITHRRGSDFAKGDGRHPITFGEDDHSPAGRHVYLNDSMKSSYRIRSNQIFEVDRTIAGSHFIITVLETTKTPEGKYLPRYFTANYFDAGSGAIERTETFTDEYKQVDGVWFPASRRVACAEKGKVVTRVIEFHNPRVRFTSEQAAR